MSKVIVVNNVTLDGVMQAPGRPDEDTRGGFPLTLWLGRCLFPDGGAFATLRLVEPTTKEG